MTIAEEVKKLREDMGLNRCQFCEYYSIPYRTMVDWEAGKRKMPEYLLRLMAYKASMEKLKKGESIMTDEMIKDLITGCRRIFGDSLNSIILYGSVARNEATEESDIDLALLLNTPMNQDKHEKFIEWGTDLDLKYNRVFSIIDIDLDRYNQWKEHLPYYKSIDMEGVVLWKIA